MPKRKAAERSVDEWDAPSPFSKLLKGLKRSRRRAPTLDVLPRTPPNRQENREPEAAKKSLTRKPSTEKERIVDDSAVESDQLEEPADSDVEGDVEAAESEDDEESSGEEDSENNAETQADEAEEAAEAMAGDDNSDGEETGATATDTWEKHFGDHVSESLAFRAAAASDRRWATTTRQDKVLGAVVTITLEGEDPVAVPEATSPIERFSIKQRLHAPWGKVNAALVSPGSQPSAPFTPLQGALMGELSSYRDLLFTHLQHTSFASVRALYALHALNHVFKTRDRVIKNTARIARASSAEAAEEPAPDCRDQGYTRPKVLIVLPFKNDALEVIKHLIALSGTTQQDNKKRFFDEFGDPEGAEQDPKKPADHRATFAGNTDDCFRVGLKFSRKQLKIYSDFYSSDIILASPLGLRMALNGTSSSKKQKAKKPDSDFLSSLEMIIVDSADVLMMQNWDHVRHVLENCNKVPKDPHGCDFSRIRAYYLDGRAKNVRQTIVFSRQHAPELNALFSNLCVNTSGLTKCRIRYEGAISDVHVRGVPQIFHRVPAASAADADDARFNFFIETVLPTLRQSVVQQKHSLIFVPSYFDFVRVRNYLDEHRYDSVELCEYTATRDISRARGDFFHGNASYMLYTERFHFYRRYQIRGVRHIVFYGIPEYGEFYAEMLNNLDTTKAAELSCAVLYTRYDRLRLERVVGSNRVSRMCDGEKDAFMFT